MASKYGWTIEYVESLDDSRRERVRYWWAVRNIHTGAEQFLSNWRKQNAGITDKVRQMFGGKS